MAMTENVSFLQKSRKFIMDAVLAKPLHYSGGILVSGVVLALYRGFGIVTSQRKPFSNETLLMT